MDLDNGKVYLSIDGTEMNSGNSVCDLTAGGPYFSPFYKHPGSGEGFTHVEANFGGVTPGGWTLSSAVNDGNGYGNFEHAPKTGHLALCTKNLGSDGG